MGAVRFLRSTDGGTTWSAVLSTLLAVTSPAAGPTRPNPTADGWRGTADVTSVFEGGARMLFKRRIRISAARHEPSAPEVSYARLLGASVVALCVTAILASVASAGTGTPTARPRPIDDSQLRALTTTIGGARPLPTTRTIPNWWGSTLDPEDGITYGYNMVGADPNTCSGAACDATIQVDITPLIVHVDGMTFSGSDVLPALLASPQFALNDYGSTPYATAGTTFAPVRGPGGALSQGDAGNPLQLQDATMRAQFNKTGISNFHLRLHPNIKPALTIDVPEGQGFLLQSGRGVVFAAVQYYWWNALVSQLATAADPTHLALYVTDDTVLAFAHGVSFWCCVLGFHGGQPSGGSKGNAPVQTLAWASWLSAGIYVRPNGGLYWPLQDMTAFSHEISEWADDPFTNNMVQSWPLVPGFPEYGCSTYLETGDPVQSSGFAMGTNTFRQGPNPNGTQSADGYFHPEDEATLPWFMRLRPNLVSEPTQKPSANIGRYTFMGDLDPFDVNQPPPPCS
jgi:hypothetical protein